MGCLVSRVRAYLIIYYIGEINALQIVPILWLYRSVILKPEIPLLKFVILFISIFITLFSGTKLQIFIEIYKYLLKNLVV